MEITTVSRLLFDVFRSTRTLVASTVVLLLASGSALAQRSDIVGSVVAAPGYWGTWTQDTYCPAGTWAKGFRQRWEAPQGSRDDTGLNTVSLQCATANGSFQSEIFPHPGIWGVWENPVHCGGSGFLTAANVRMENPMGSDDDSAANAVIFRCSDGQQISGNLGSWGNWQGYQACPMGSVVCGASIRFETDQGGGDDTAMNGLKLLCCKAPAPPP